MPWCDSCSAYHAPTALNAGACPTCGGPTQAGRDDSETPTVGASAPWHFWLVVVLLGLYLVWRIINLVIWVVT